jgi:P4 family phage/plasmid primase-like protien
MSSINFNYYVDAFRKKEKGGDFTNTRMGNDSMGIYPGSYEIPDSEYETFLKRYSQEVLVTGGIDYFTEKQLASDGPIAVDLDFRFPYGTPERYYTQDHIDDLVGAYIDEISRMFQLNESSMYQILVMEKSGVYHDTEKNVTKDGIHMIITISAERRMQILLRNRMVDKLQKMWGDMPITNTWDDVLDEGISLGHTPWQLYGSTKPGKEPYKLTQIYTVGYDPNDGQPTIDRRSKDDTDWAPNWSEMIHKLTIRCRTHPRFFYRSDFVKELDTVKVPKRGGGSGAKPASAYGSKELSKFTVAVLQAKSQSDLEQVLEEFEEDNEQKKRWTWNETLWYIMALPEQYYGANSYAKWVRVGMALKSESEDLFVIWVAFSAKSREFDFDGIEKMFEKWNSFCLREDGLTTKSIVYWCKSDAPKQYVAVKTRCAEATLERAIGGYDEIDETVKVIDRKGTTDYDLACVLFSMYGYDYKCVDIQNNKWYKFVEPRWKQIDAGVDLRREISGPLRALYFKKANEYGAMLDALPDDEDRKTAKLKLFCKKLRSVCERLGSTNDKKNIMTEAKELFHDPDFEEKLDLNPYLICFQNGVVDFKAPTKETIFRRGVPEDYLTKCTKIDYIPVDPIAHKPIIDEIRDFMCKLFPECELCEYMWNHLAATMTGLIRKSQTFNIYIGGGQNGKSVLIKLMDTVLGEYKTTMPVNMLTDRRGKVGSASPEVMALKGSRMAVAQEPQKNERLNDGVVKEFSSGEDKIQGRALYSGKMIEFLPLFQLILCTNYLPEITSNDHGIWRRVRVVPFKSLFTENPVTDDPDKPYQFKIDREISQRMESWKEVFASMLVDRAYQNQGAVPDCDIVLAASNEYRQGQDCIAQFIAERIVVEPSGTVTKTEINAEFKGWYESTYGRRGGPSAKEVHVEMDKRKYKKQGKCWVGIKISYESDRQDVVDDDDISDAVIS